MRRAALALIALAGCGGHASTPAAPAPDSDPVLRWVPERPTYLFSSPSVSDGQRSVRDAIDVLGMSVGYDARAVGAALQGVLGVDPLQPEPLAQIGIDTRGSWAVFSTAWHPTVVVHLSAPAQTAAFLDKQRARGLAATSVSVDGTPVFTADLGGELALSWAIAGDWLWLHAAPSGATDAAWFTASHGPHGNAWAESWAWSERVSPRNGAAMDARVGSSRAGSRILGFIDVGERLPAAAACLGAVPSLRRVAFALEGDERHSAARITLDTELKPPVLAPPSGWDAVAAKAAIAAQWNVDLTAVRGALAPCLKTFGVDPAPFDELAVRAGRGVLLDFNASELSGSGAIALDLASPTYISRQLDRIPLRKTLERRRSFNGHSGATIDIPFSVTVEYVLEPALFVAGLGEGVVAQLFAPGPAKQPPLFAIDVAPPALSSEAWANLMHILVAREVGGAPGPHARRLAERLRAWSGLHLAVSQGDHAIALTASAERAAAR